jgi:hypothetical protein
VTEAPAGFRRSVDTGLLLPVELSRVREVWTRDERRLLERAVAMLTRKGMRQYLKCDHAACAAAPIERVPAADGGFVLRCAHADRVFTQGY